MTADLVKLFLALILVNMPGDVVAQGQTIPAIRLVDAAAPREVIACVQGTAADESDNSFDGAIEEADKNLLGEALRLRIRRVGESFVNEIEQTQDDRPVNFELCRSIGEQPSETTDLTFRELPPRAVRVGYCPSTDADRCREALKAALAPAPVAANPAAPPPFVVTRVVTWSGSAAPSSASQMLDAVVRTTAISIEPQAGSQAGGAMEIRDEEPRPIGSPPGTSAAAAARMEAPAHRPATGFVFAVSK